MNDQNSSSQKQREQVNHKVVELYLKGEWPPVGHPLRALGQLPPEVVKDWFHSPVWVALVEGLHLYQSDSNRLAINTTKPLGIRDAACGIIQAVDYILEIPVQLESLWKVAKE